MGYAMYEVKFFVIFASDEYIYKVYTTFCSYLSLVDLWTLNIEVFP